MITLIKAWFLLSVAITIAVLVKQTDAEAKGDWGCSEHSHGWCYRYCFPEDKSTWCYTNQYDRCNGKKDIRCEQWHHCEFNPLSAIGAAAGHVRTCRNQVQTIFNKSPDPEPDRNTYEAGSISPQWVQDTDGVGISFNQDDRDTPPQTFYVPSSPEYK